MGWFKKIFKGIKGVVKKAAKTIKKINKKIITAIPGGKKLWELGGKALKKVASGVGKVVNKLGPIGMIALSVLAPYAAPLWASFGAAASVATAAGSVWGSIGSAVFTAGNWVGGTISAMSSGISNAIGTIAEGGFSGLGTSLGKAGEQAFKGFADSFSGKAGAMGVKIGVEQASEFTLKQAAGQSLLDQTTSKIMGDVAGQGASTITQSKANAVLEQNMSTAFDPSGINLGYVPQQSNIAGFVDQGLASGKIVGTAAQKSIAEATVMGTLNSSGGTLGTTVAKGTSLLSKATKVAKTLLDQDSPMPLPMPQTIQPIASFNGVSQFGNASSRGGVTSGGGDFLSQSMLTAMQGQQQRMTRGFGNNG
jgi:hypothetical protein